jgi:Domain of unknown function (DUF397)
VPETGKLHGLHALWRKSSHCDTNSCVEVASIDGAVWLRNSQDPTRAIAFTPDEWSLFAGAVRAGEFEDLTRGAEGN